nr:hypothetical protein B0A51_11619 [Rachicladosporium sp. CCFEE 5018]
MSTVTTDYPWTSQPLIAVAPMRLICLSKLASEVSNAGGLGFIGIGSDASTLEAELTQATSELTVKSSDDTLPVGVGFLLWAGEPLLQASLPLLAKFKPAAVWLFAPSQPGQLAHWTTETRKATGGKSKIWIQIGTVAAALDTVANCQPDVLVVQGSDAGGHGLEECAGLISLLPEVDDAVTALCQSKSLPKPTLIAAGGLSDGRGVAASTLLGASGAVLGTRYLACPEANLTRGYQNAVLAASDGGVKTARGKLYDRLRGTNDWPAEYGGRGILNKTWHDHKAGLSEEENQRLYDEAMQRGDEGWGDAGRLTTYAGAGVGLVKRIQPAGEITREVREEARKVLKMEKL